MKKRVYGFGITDIQNVTLDYHQHYITWKHLLERCFSGKYHERYPTAKAFSIEEEWLTFSNFKDWMEQQNWNKNYINKNIIYKNCKHYSKDTCLFVPKHLNTLFTFPDTKSKDLPIGVHHSKDKKWYISRITKFGKTYTIGRYKTVNLALKEYNKEKIKYIEELIQTIYDRKVINALHNYCEKYLK